MEIANSAAPTVDRGIDPVRFGAPIGADATGIVEEHIHVVDRVAVCIQVVIDGVIDEIAHQAVAVGAAQQVGIGITDGSIDQRLGCGIVGIALDDSFNCGAFRRSGSIPR
jgi:hypothetical protein